jgi:AraC-like DNA-binding protein
MIRLAARPHPALRPYVHEHWAIERDFGAGGRFVVTPDAHAEWIACAGAWSVVERGVPRPLPAAIVIGLLRAPLEIAAAGTLRCVATRLAPIALGTLCRAWTGTRRRAWYDATSPALGIGDRAPADLAAIAWPALTRMLDDAWLARLAAVAPPGDAAALAALVSTRADAVAARLGRSRRQVERRARALTTLSPKQLAALARFQRARDALWERPDADLARLAVDLGYADQAHLTRQFRRYAGQTPRAFARDVAIVQDRRRGDR